ncbi:aspartate carbamoyltransferase regulatory subunit [Alistipes sp. OttesenSCG-928-B03]|nr:aspartate carbamoyltransferase regulatory subunit [Alistipes sp. OttesenSCG-928-B03]
MKHDKKLEVTAIENGTVIDHIPANKLFKIIDILRLDRETHRITFGTNLESKRMGAKAIIKINDRYCLPMEINQIALVAPQAVVNTIHDFAVTEKRQVSVPDEIEGFARCANPKCITNNQIMTTAFTVIHTEDDGMALRCRYCEKVTYLDQLEIIKEA